MKTEYIAIPDGKGEWYLLGQFNPQTEEPIWIAIPRLYSTEYQKQKPKDRIVLGRMRNNPKNHGVEIVDMDGKKIDLYYPTYWKYADIPEPPEEKK